jgi:phospholipid-binding lipoprotein MlaA
MVSDYWLFISFACCLFFSTVPCHAGISKSPVSNQVMADFLVTEENKPPGFKLPARSGSGDVSVGQTAPLNICQSEADEDFEDFSDEYDDEDLIPDPLEPVNRVFFRFNDKMYFWAVKPVATYYKDTVPLLLRASVRNFFSNLKTPVRAVNCLLQGKFEGLGRELIRFSLNSLWLGFCDPASQTFKIQDQDEDLGQTFGFHGLGPGLYINWPVLGPSSLRDTVGAVGDGYLNPLYYLEISFTYDIAIGGYKTLNSASFRLGEYESLKKAAIDPYIALREAYHENRQHKIKD